MCNNSKNHQQEVMKCKNHLIQHNTDPRLFTCSFFLANEARRASKKQKNTALLMPLDKARAPTPLQTAYDTSEYYKKLCNTMLSVLSKWASPLVVSAHKVVVYCCMTCSRTKWHFVLPWLSVMYVLWSAYSCAQRSTQPRHGQNTE